MVDTFGDIGNSKENVNDYLKNLADDLSKNPSTDINDGHNALMNDLADLVKQAHEYEFNDFKNNTYPAPKVELRNRLMSLAENVVNGKYDN